MNIHMWRGKDIVGWLLKQGWREALGGAGLYYKGAFLPATALVWSTLGSEEHAKQMTEEVEVFLQARHGTEWRLERLEKQVAQLEKLVAEELGEPR